MKKTLITTLVLMPIHVYAAANQTVNTFVDKIIGLINVIVPILISLAIALFFYHSGAGIFGNSDGNVEARSKLKETLLWGVGIIFVMVSIWGILNLITTEFDLIKTR